MNEKPSEDSQQAERHEAERQKIYRQQSDRRNVYIIDGARTPFLKAQGKPGPFMAADLAVAASRPLLARQKNISHADFDEVITGCVMPDPEEVNIGRVISLRLGFGKKVPAWTVQRNCASGLQALDSAYLDIITGRSNLVLAGGTDAMSNAPLLFNKKMVVWFSGLFRAKGIGKLAHFAKFRPAMLSPVIALLKGLTDHTVGLSMGQTAEIVAERFSITREMMDAYSMESHKRLAAAQDAKRLVEIEPVYDSRGNHYSDDTGLRRDSSMESLAKLKPIFDKPFGSVTAGNSSQVTDGAAFVIVASEDAVKKHGLKPLCKIIDTRWAGVDPAQMGLGPASAMGALLAARSMKTADIDYWEINEAFAAQVLGALAAFSDDAYCKEELGLDKGFDPIPMDRLNVDGGAISLGHPVGASGARIVLRLAHTLIANKARFGMASLCIGGGQGGAMLIERVEE